MSSLGVNISGPNLKVGTNIVTLPGFAVTQAVTFSKPLAAASAGRLLWDAYSLWPTDAGNVPTPSPVPGQTYTNRVSIYGNNGAADVLLFSAPLDPNLYANAALAFAALAAVMPVTLSGYATYKLVGDTDPNPGDNRGGLSILVEADDPTSGISYPAHADAAFAMVTGAAQADFPVQNLDDTASLRTLFRATAAGAVALTFTRPTTAEIRFLGLLHHNAELAATFRWRLFGAGAPDPVGNAANLIYDSTALPFYPAGKSELFPAVTPHILPAYASVISGRLDLSAQTAAWEIGALEIAGWWDWPAISVPRELGVDNTDVEIIHAGGADHVMAQWAPRTLKGDRSEILVADEAAMIQAFQFDKGVSRNFVVLRNYGDPATWARECFVARNNSLPKLNKAGHPVGRFSFDLIEALR